MSLRLRPSKQCTNTDLVLGALLGFVAGILAASAVAELAGDYLKVVDTASEFVALTCFALVWLPVLALVCGGFVRFRVASRLSLYEEHRMTALAKGKCPACRYDLRGTAEPRCPECGERFDEQEWPPGQHDAARTSDPPNSG